MPATANFQKFPPQLLGPADHAFVITPNDSADLTYATRAIYVGGTGDLKITTVGGETLTFTAIPAGSVVPLRATKVFATGTTATFLIGLY